MGADIMTSKGGCIPPDLVTNSIIFCCICTIKDHGKKVVLCVIGIFLLLFHPFIPKTLNSFLTTARINLINKCDPYKFVNDISKNTHLKT